jgi:hypothetical protein
MKSLFTMEQPEHQLKVFGSAPANRNDDDPAIVTMGRISDLTTGSGSTKTDDPNKWSDKE